MTPGEVISLRINPRDVMAISDTLDHLGQPKQNLSLSQATSIVLRAALESFRQQGVIPTRSGFEYSEMLEVFKRPNIGGKAAKLRTARALAMPTDVVQPVIPETPERRSRRLRFEELMFKQSADALNFTDEDMAELAPLLEEFQS